MGHPTGYVTAGALAYIIAEIVGGTGLRESIFNTIEKLSSENSGMECTKKLNQALDLSGIDIPDYKAISEIGEGWIVEEALSQMEDNFKNVIKEYENISCFLEKKINNNIIEMIKKENEFSNEIVKNIYERKEKNIWNKTKKLHFYRRDTIKKIKVLIEY